MSLKGKTAIVTGSTSGIGLGIAQCLAKEGCNLVLSGSRSPDDAKEIVEELRTTFKVEVLYSQVDFSQPQVAAEKLFADTIGKFKTVHILDDFLPEKWDQIIAVNLSSAFHTMHLAVPLMKKNEGKWGRIINISSVHGVVASVNKSAYVASKHGLNGLTKVVALETAGDTNITCNTICPGWVLTPLVQRQIDIIAQTKNISIEAATEELVGAKQPSKRFTTATQVGEMTVFLCSSAASNLTGANHVMDGGWTTQ